MDIFTRNDLNALLQEQSPPCVSIFMRTHPGGAVDDPIRWRQLVSNATTGLASFGVEDSDKFVAAATRLLKDVEFWQHQGDGLAMFLSSTSQRLFRLPIPFEDQVAIADRFLILPLLPLFTGNGKFFVLALSQNKARLLQATRESISEVQVAGMPKNIEQALQNHDRDEPLTFHTRPTSGGGWGAIFEGHGVGIDDKKDDLLRYFRQIDASLHSVLRNEKAPLVVAAVDYLIPIFRRANKYAHLVEEGVVGNPDRLDNRELRDRGWSLVQPFFDADQRRAIEQYQKLENKGYTAAGLDDVVIAAVEGRIDKLFVSHGPHRWGLFDRSSRRIERHDPALAGDVDLTDFAAAQALSHGGTVFVMPPDRVPDRTGIAAVLVHPLAKHGKRL